MIKRRKTKTVTVGGVMIGSGHPISIQSMTKTDTSDVDATVKEIHLLEEAGCEIVRVSIKGMEDAGAILQIKEKTHIPLVADIHFDYRLALKAIEQGADKIRINPGNIADSAHIEEVIDAAAKKKIPIRIGVNSGSLPEGARGNDTADKMVSAVLEYLKPFKRKNFQDIVLSLKASDVFTTVEAYKRMAAKCDYPLHLGVTAAGLPGDGIVKSSIGIGALLLGGVGDTVRVSLTGDSVVEVEVAKGILASVGARNFGPELIACPTCGRCQVDLVSVARQLEKELRKSKIENRNIEKHLVIAIMGCEVNGPGEAKDADIGIAFGKNKGVIFRKGKIVKTVGVENAIEELLQLI